MPPRRTIIMAAIAAVCLLATVGDRGSQTLCLGESKATVMGNSVFLQMVQHIKKSTGNLVTVMGVKKAAGKAFNVFE